MGWLVRKKYSDEENFVENAKKYSDEENFVQNTEKYSDEEGFVENATKMEMKQTFSYSLIVPLYDCNCRQLH